MSTAPYLSVVIPTYNRVASLHRLMSALEAQTYPFDRFEAIVVDDGSSDGTVAELRTWRLPFALHVMQQEHGGPAKARNLGVVNSAGEIIVFVDDDVVPLPGLLEAHAASHRLGDDLVVVGPMSPPVDWRRPAWVRWEEETLQVQYRDMLAGKYPCTPRQFYTANVSLRRDRFLDAGGFDVSFKRAEDIELAFRLRDRGARFLFNPSADVRHYASRTLDAWTRIPYQYGRYDVVMARDKGQETLQLATYEFHGRSVMTRWATRLCVGRPLATNMAVRLTRLGVAILDRLRAPHSAVGPVLSGMFNVLYWQGVCDELGGRTSVMSALQEGERMTEKPPVIVREAPTLDLR